MNSVKIMFVCLFAILCGCGPSAKQLAEQEAIQKSRQNFREAVAAVKVCTDGSTYEEFREKRLALETSYTANEPALADKSKDFKQLLQLMKATDALWDYQIKFPEIELSAGKGSGWVAHGWALDPWEAMLIIKPQVAEKADYKGEQLRNDPDFYAKNYVRRGLTLISKQCDAILSQ
ncbi:MAG: hypothetical protein ABSC89_01225 [Verrucomicrobiota bacterium]|jgi:hypothetical protein